MQSNANNGNVKIAREYRDKYGAETTTRKLARIMYKENPLSFNDEESARFMLRYIEGKTGKKMAKNVSNTKYFMEEVRPSNPYALPESDEEMFEPYVLKGHSLGLVINDIHLPYHNTAAITSCFNYAKKQKPDFVFINGDLLDFHQLSYFEKDPRKKRFSEELTMFKEFFQILEKTFKCKIYFKFGNHEERYEKFLFQKAHELKGVNEFELDNIIKARAEGIEVIKDKRIVLMNKLPFVHGHEFGRQMFSPVNAARGLFLQAKHSCVKGDCHNTSQHPEPNIFGEITMTWSVGCLCGLTPRWLPINKWNHGFAIIELDKNKVNYKFRNFSIYKGEIL